MPPTNHPQRLTKHFWTPVRLALTAMVLLLLAAFGVSSCHSADQISQPNSSVTTAPVNSPSNVPSAPAALATLPPNVLDAELKAASGAPIKLSNYSGKVLLVNLWATWCGPCRGETPELVKLHKEFHRQGLEIVGLSTEDPEGSAESVKNFIDTFEVGYRIGWATPEVQITFMRMTGRDAIPQSFLVSRDGHIIKRFVGFNPTTTPPQLKQAIEEALNDRAKLD
jgi:glutathione peroxidase-family protein